MTAQAKQNGSQQQVNPALLVVLGIVIVGAGGYYAYNNFMQPGQGSPVAVVSKQAPNNAAPSPIQQTNPAENGTSTSQPQTETNIDTNGEGELLKVTQSNRDPFIPSSLYKQAKQIKIETAPQPDNGTPTTIAIKPVNTPVPNPRPVIIWDGTVASENDQVVILRYNNKPNYLRLGDKVPGTNYIVAEINNNSVMLLSPKDKMLLNRKKEAKPNDQK